MLKAKIINVITKKGKYIPLNKNGSVLDLNLYHVLVYVLKQQKNKNLTFDIMKEEKLFSLYNEKLLLNNLKANQILFLRGKYKALKTDFLILNIKPTRNLKASNKEIKNFINKYKLNKGMNKDIPFLYSINFYSYYIEYFNKLQSLEFQINQKETNIKNFKSYYNDFKGFDKLNNFDLRQFKKGILTDSCCSVLNFYFNTIKKSRHKIAKKSLELIQRLEIGFIKELDIKTLLTETINLNFKELSKNNTFKINSRYKKAILNN